MSAVCLGDGYNNIQRPFVNCGGDSLLLQTLQRLKIHHIEQELER